MEHAQEICLIYLQVLATIVTINIVSSFDHGKDDHSNVGDDDVSRKAYVSTDA